MGSLRGLATSSQAFPRVPPRICLCSTPHKSDVHRRPPYGDLVTNRQITGGTMLERYFAAPKMLGHLRTGPSGQYVDAFAAELHSDGYSAATAVRYIRAAAHLGHVLQQQGGTLADIDIATFYRHLQSCRCPRSKGGGATITLFMAPGGSAATLCAWAYANARP